MASHAQVLRRAGFRDVQVLTHRYDAAPEVKAAARDAFRATVAEGAREDHVVVVPLLLSAGGVERQVEADLAELEYRFAHPLMPHALIERWVATQLEGDSTPAAPVSPVPRH